MLRTTSKVLAGTVMFSALMTGTALAADPVSVVGATTEAVDDTRVDVSAIDLTLSDTTCTVDGGTLLDVGALQVTTDDLDAILATDAATVGCDVGDDTLPDGTLPDDTLPDDTLPDGTLPDGTLPDGTLPDGAEVDGVGGVTGVTKVPGAIGGTTITTRPTTARSAVVGYIRIVWTAAGGPSYWLSGALQDGNQWSCVGGGGGASYSVTCSPVRLPVGVRYTCDVLHADIATTSASGAGQTSLDCDSDGVPEARTRYVVGSGRDFRWAVDTRPVTRFTCTVDLVVPNITSGCGDPGLAGVE